MKSGRMLLLMISFLSLRKIRTGFVNVNELWRDKRDIEAFIKGGRSNPLTIAVAIFKQSDPNPRPSCSGTVLSSTFVLSAGHCMEDITTFHH